MHQGKVVTIGQEAIDENEKILIFFGKGVTDGLRPYSIIQEVEQAKDIELAVGGSILFGTQEYQITYVGHLANQNLQTIQHISFVFSEVPTDKLSSSVYLTPAKLPEITEGMTITYR